MKFYQMIGAVGLCAVTFASPNSKAIAASAGTVTGSLQITTTWQGNPGYCAIVVVTNDTATPFTWNTATFSVDAASIYTSWWNNTLQGTTGTVVMGNNTPVVVPANSSASPLGFCATGAVPTSLGVVLNAPAGCSASSCPAGQTCWYHASPGTPGTTSCQTQTNLRFDKSGVKYYQLCDATTPCAYPGSVCRSDGQCY